MEVFPPVLMFDAANKVRTYQVKLSPMWKLHGEYTFGSLTWHNDQKVFEDVCCSEMPLQFLVCK